MSSIQRPFLRFRSVKPLFILIVVAGLVAATSCRGALRPTVVPTQPQTGHVVPLPRTIKGTASESFSLTPATKVIVPPGSNDALRIGQYLADLLSTDPKAGPAVEQSGATGDGHVRLLLGGADAPSGSEAYNLSITPRGVTIAASQPAGLFYGVQTLRHLLPPALEYAAVRPFTYTLPATEISDAPRFAWRGAMLDVARHFFSVEEVKRYIDLLAMLKLNRLHLHLADDQGWRIEIQSWPNLTKHGGSTEVGGGPGGFYTRQQYADLVTYANERFITIVPEIDMPGHTNAALASYAELNCDGVAPPLYTGIEVGFSTFCVDKDITYKFIDDVVREIAAMTPGPYFHIGGDEVKKLTDDQYRRFIERVQAIVKSHGKEAVGWDEIAPAQLLPTTIVQHWRPDAFPKQAVEKKARLIMSPANKAYIDMKYNKLTPIGLDWAAIIEVRDAYDWDPLAIAAGLSETSVLGVEAPIWSETLANIRDVEYLAFPRIAAIAEIAWSPREGRSWNEFRTRLGAQAPRWTALGINFYRSPQVPWVQ
jgi:hexosaminidase